MSMFKDKRSSTEMKLASANKTKNAMKPALQSTMGEKAVRGAKPQNGFIRKRQVHHVDFLYSLYFAKTKKGMQS
ncbi:MAG: hypothetical protein ACE5I1_00935 [bacterium]